MSNPIITRLPAIAGYGGGEPQGPPSFTRSLNVSDHKCHTQRAKVDCENEIGRRQPWRWGRANGRNENERINSKLSFFVAAGRAAGASEHRCVSVNWVVLWRFALADARRGTRTTARESDRSQPRRQCTRVDCHQPRRPSGAPVGC